MINILITKKIYLGSKSISSATIWIVKRFYYIRSHYEGANDYEKLLAYGKENNIEFDYTTGSNYHNRFTPKDGFKRPYNMKVQVPQGNSAKGKDLNNARMVEFIVNLDTGEFESQWDAYDNHKLADGRYDSNPGKYSNEELERNRQYGVL